MFSSSGGGFGTGTTGFGSSTAPFGTSTGQQQTPSAFGGTTFGSGTTSAFGSKPAFGSTTTTSGFGTSTAFGAKSSVFGAPAASTATAFGAPAPGTSTFGRTTSTSPFGATPAPATGTFGSTTGAFGTAVAPSSPFGAPAPASGLGGFGSTASNPFGKPVSSPFGAPAAAAPATSSVFGAPASASATGGFGGFGATSTTGGGLFGSTPAPSTGVFGAPAPAAGAGLFGSTPAATSLGVFGSGTSALGVVAQKGTGNPSWRETRAEDPSGKSGGNLMSISAMKEYEGKSHEELRLEDYLQNRKNSSAVSTANKSFSTTPAQSTGLFGGFGSTPAPAPAGGAFSFGGMSTSAFGASKMPAPAAGGFGSFGVTPAPAPSTSLFGTPAPAPTPAFGAPAPAPAGGFSFGSSAIAPAPSFTGLFGTTSTAPAPATGVFGAPAPTAGTFTFAGGFGSSASTPAPAPGVFGSTIGGFGTPSPAPTTGTGFSVFGAPAPAPAGGGFGSVAGGGGLFSSNLTSAPPAAGSFNFGKTAGAPAASTGTNAFSFGSTTKPTAGMFGAPASSGGLFGSVAPVPAPGAFSFGAPTPVPAAAGGFGSGSTFGSSAPASTNGAGFGAPATGSLFGAASTMPGTATSFGTFGVAPAQQQQQQQQQRVAVHNQDPYGTAGNAGFGSGALEQKMKGVQNSSQQLFIRFGRAGTSSGIGTGDQGSKSSSGQASSSTAFAFRRTPRSRASIQPRGLGTAGRQGGGGSSAGVPPSSSSRLLTEGTLTPGGNAGVLSPDVYLSGGAKRISFPSGGREDTDQPSPTSAIKATVKPPEVEKGDVVNGGQRTQQPLALEQDGDGRGKDSGVEETKGDWSGAATTGPVLTVSASKVTGGSTKGEGKIDDSGSDGKAAGVVAISPQVFPQRRETRLGRGGSEASPHPSSEEKVTDVRAAAIGAGEEASPAGNGERLFVDGGGYRASGFGPPTLDVEGYETRPPMSELEVMGDEALRAVSDFEVIRAGFGSIAWSEPVDLRGVDIGSVVKIEYRSASVYDALPEGEEKPPLGTGLNQPAVVTLYSVLPKAENPSDEQNHRYEARVHKITDKIGAKLVSYDVRSGTWIFKTFHWSRYAMDESDDDDNDHGVKTKAKDQKTKKGPNEMAPPPPRNPVAGRSRKPTPMKEPRNGKSGKRRQSGPTATTHGGIKYYMPDTDEEGSVAGNASDNEGIVLNATISRGGGSDREEKAEFGGWNATTVQNTAGGNNRGDRGGSDVSVNSRLAAHDYFFSPGEPFKQDYARSHLLDDIKDTTSLVGGGVVRDGAGRSFTSSTKSSPPVLMPPLPQRRALRNPEDAEAAKSFRPLIADPESRVLRLLAKAWKTAPGELEEEGARGIVRAGRMVTDHGLRMGRGFRASWGPGGMLVCPGAIGGQDSGKAIGRHAVRVVRFDPTPAASGRDAESLYVGPLRNHLRFAQPRLEGWNVPRWELPRRRNDEPDHYADLIRCMHGYAAVYEETETECSHASGGGKVKEDGPDWVLEQSWRLASAIWGQEEGDGMAQDLPVPGDVYAAAADVGSAGEGDGASPAARREAAVANWLANAVASCVPVGGPSQGRESAAQAKADEEGRKPWQRILELLSVRRVNDAAEVAMDAGLPRLAVALTAAATQAISRSAPQDANKFIAQQVTLWQGNGVDARMPQEAFVVYQLLGREGFRDVRLRGVIDKSSYSLHPSLDWLRQLGLCLWYGAGASVGNGSGGAVADAVKAYGSLVTDKEALPPTARYFRESTHHDKADLDEVCRELRRVHVGESIVGSGRDCCVLNRLLAMYPSRATGSGASGVALLAALEPMAVTPDVMDYRHSWHLMSVVEALGVAEIPDRSKVAIIAEGLRSQLVSAGLWEWAVYVALTIEGDADRREATAQELVVRHGYGLLEPVPGSKDEQRRRLLHEIHVPVSWLYKAAAIRAGYEHQSALPTPVSCIREDNHSSIVAGAKAEKTRETKLKYLISAASVELDGDMATEACMLAPCSIYLGGSARKRLVEYFEKIDLQLMEGALDRASLRGRSGVGCRGVNSDAVGGAPRSKEFDAYKEILEAAEEGAASTRLMLLTKEKKERLTCMRSMVEPAAARILGVAVAREAMNMVLEEAGVTVA